MKKPINSHVLKFVTLFELFRTILAVVRHEKSLKRSHQIKKPLVFQFAAERHITNDFLICSKEFIYLFTGFNETFYLPERTNFI